MHDTVIIFPHQLFADLTPLKGRTVYLVEIDLFFNQYPFHKQKISYHRATMQAYADLICDQVSQLNYIESNSPCAKIPLLIDKLTSQGIETISIYPAHDDWLSQQLEESCHNNGLKIKELSSPMFLNKVDDLSDFFCDNSTYFHHKFYQQQRRKHQLLMQQGKPIGNRWSFDHENRKKYPINKRPPALIQTDWTSYHQQATEYTAQHFNKNYGQDMHQNNAWIYPVNHQQAKDWLDDFIRHRLIEFGPYEDAICVNQSVLNHSVLTPMLNIGLLTPRQVINCILEYSNTHDIPLNSLEGFIRQIIGWREYMQGLYQYTGRRQRCSNRWQHQRAMPKSFYTGNTGIEPFDQTIKKVLATGYCHHIERLMILGNFMFLCEIHPDAVYQWFMELFIDAYDWVMVPNVYGMSQFADGGLMATKPYISGSNYIKKMSDYATGDWCTTWDALYWRFIDKHIDYFKHNNRTAMMAHNWSRQQTQKKQSHLKVANNFLSNL